MPHGTVLGGQYRVGRVLGRPGGFGITYLGWDIYLQQKVAIKEYLPPEIAARIPHSLGITVHTRDYRKGFEAGKEQFLREARLVAQLNHPNVVRVRGFFNANDTAYLIMDYYEGMTLESYFEQIKNTIDPDTAVALMLLVLDGLAYVHTKGVVHRDVKPNNIYLAAVGRPILLDFGAARQAVEAQLHSLSVVFTEGYAPMEQYQRRGVQGPWTDVYGAGATLFRMISGGAPPVPMDRAGDQGSEKGAPSSLSDALRNVPKHLHAVFERALALRPEERYPSAAEFQTALTTATAEQSRPAADEASTPAAFISEANAQRVQDVAAAPTPPSTPPPATSSLIASSSKEVIPPRPAEGPGATVEFSFANDKAGDGRRSLLPLLAMLVIAFGLFLFLRYGREGGDRSGLPGPVPRNDLPVGVPAELLVKAVAPATVLVTDGVFVLSEPATTDGADISRETRLPQYRITQTEVGIAEFRTFVSLANYRGAGWDTHPCEGAPAGGDWQHPGYVIADDRPVTCVSWHDAQAYADWLGQQTGHSYRLPTEAEWDFAARAGTRTLYWWGNDYSSAYAACADCAGARVSAPGPMRRFPPNPLGLYGVSDNVREWTCSRFENPETIAASGCLNGNAEGAVTVRGGSWHDSREALESNYRAAADSDARSAWTGFRLVELVEAPAPATPPPPGN